MSLLGLIGCILYLPVVIAQAFFHDYTTALVLLFAAAAISLFNVHVYLYHTKNPEPDDTWLFGPKWMTGL